jgi:Flp pilus assembly CpaE family ATPase
MSLSSDSRDFSGPASLEYADEVNDMSSGDFLYTRSASGSQADTFSLSVALILPDAHYREEVSACLADCHCSQVRTYTSYPPHVDDIPQLLGRQFDVIIIDLDSNMELALDLVECICAQGSAMVMVCSAKAGPDLMLRCMRAGAREFLSFPLDKQVLVEAMVRAAAHRPTGDAEQVKLGKSLIFMGTKGGAGVTTIASNFAVALAQHASQRTLLLDLDLPLGDAALNLGIQPAYSTINALQAGERLDSTFLESLLVKHSSGLWVLPAPGKYVPYQPSNAAIEHLVEVARREFACVVVDLGSRLDLSETSIFREADTIFLVTQVGIADLRNSSRLITHYFSAGKANVEVVVNRYESGGLGVDDKQITKLLTRPVRWKIPNDYNAVRKMQVSGTPLVLSNSPISRLILKMAESVVGEIDSSTGDEAEEKKPGFKLKSAFGLGSFRRARSSKNEDESLSVVPHLRLSSGETGESSLSGGEASTAEEHPAQEPSGHSGGKKKSRGKDGAESAAAAPAKVTPETRTYKGAVYVKGEDGQWHRRDGEHGDTAQEIPGVFQAVPTISWPEPAPITYGTRLSAAQLNAIASVPGTFSYAPMFGEMLDVGTHTIIASFVPDDTSSNAPAQATISLKVNKGVPVISWEMPEAISYGTELSYLQLNAATDAPGRFVYNPGAGTVLAEGIHALSVIFLPEDSSKYNTALAVVPITVAKSTPAITWPEPAPIVYGTALSSLQLNAKASVPGMFIYNPEEGAMLPAGSHTLSVTYLPEATDYYSDAHASVALTVAKAMPMIRWAEPSPIGFGTALSGEHFAVAASVPGEFVFTPNPGDVLDAGEHTLTAQFKPEDEENYSTAEVSVVITVAKVTPHLSWQEAAEVIYGTGLNAEQLNATASVPGTIAYLPGAGEVLRVGEHTIKALFTPDDQTNYAVAQASLLITVHKAVPVVTWPEQVSMTYGTAWSEEQLKATASIPGTFQFNPAAGEILPVGRHTIAAVFMPYDNANYLPAQATVAVSVERATPTVTWPAPEAIVYGSALGAEQLNASSTVAGSFVYKPAAGTILGAGQQSIKAIFTPEDGTNYLAAQVSVALTVAKATPSLSWTGPEPITFGEKLGKEQLNAVASVPGRFVYSPAAGEVLDAGSHTLRADFTPSDSANYCTAQTSVSITVNKAVPSISWLNPTSIVHGTALSKDQLNAQAEVSGSFVYSPAAGELLATDTHTLSVTFLPQDAANYFSANATVSLTVRKASPAIVWLNPAPITYGTALDAAQLNAKTTISGNFVYVPAAGEVLGAGTHTLEAIFAPEDNANYAEAYASVSITVGQATPALSWMRPQPINYGTALGAEQLNAVASVPGSFVYMPPEGAMLSAGSHMPTVIFTPEDSANYKSAQAAVALIVNKATPSIKWRDPSPLTSGNPLSVAQLNAKASVPGKFAYFPRAGTVLAPGTHNIQATFVPTDAANYTSAQASVTLSITEMKETEIEWPAPAPIKYGTPLGSEQFNATASVPGTFVYSPCEGTVLAAGMQTLQVTFIPDNDDEYASAQASISLLVEGGDDSSQWLLGGSETGSRDTSAASAAEAAETARTGRSDASQETSNPDVRVYKGATYVKEADGQWHLLKK